MPITVNITVTQRKALNKQNKTIAANSSKNVHSKWLRPSHIFTKVFATYIHISPIRKTINSDDIAIKGNPIRGFLRVQNFFATLMSESCNKRSVIHDPDLMTVERPQPPKAVVLDADGDEIPPLVHFVDHDEDEEYG